ncbi:uncharacterized protein LOC125260506 [Megalobrama amblycephala]|uniref:uncharacterized protein LOC125260506 n=1 Tax=Megalobrama amblycephala TaxID=75352 RepID=UPI002014126D|nr:uncharacterized protein LOC125260506 [Megalobrama amblycephala]
MLRKNARLIPTTEKGGLATPLWTDSEFKSLLGKHMDSIVTESVRLDLTKKFGIHPEKVWSIEECKKVLGACIRKKNMMGIICCHREFTLSIAQDQIQRIAKLEEQNKQLHTRVSRLTQKLGLNKASTKCDSKDQQSDESYPDLQSFCILEGNSNTGFMDKDVNAVEVCGVRQKAQSRAKGVDTVPSVTPILQLQAVSTTIGPEDIERIAENLPSVHRNFSEFRTELSRKMKLYDMSLAEVTQLMSQILKESEFNDFESAVNSSEFQHSSKGELREGVLRVLQNLVGPKVDWSKITSCVQKDETVSEYTERFCQSAAAYSGIVDTPEKVLEDNGPLVRMWFDGLSLEYRNALPFLDLTWSNGTLQNNLDRLAIWERDSDVKTRVKIAAASFKVNTENRQKRKRPKREGSCHYCGKPGHWMKECRKNKKTLKEMNSFTQLLLSLLATLKLPLPSSPNSWSNSLLTC